MAITKNKKTGKWKAEVWYRQKRYSTQSFSIKAHAERFQRETLAAIEANTFSKDQKKDYSYNEIFEFWYVNASSRKRQPSLIKDLQMHKQYIEPILGSLRVSEIMPPHLEEIVSEMLKKDLSKASVNKVIQHFKAVFNHSFNNETIGRNPTKSFKQLKLDAKEMAYLTQEEMDQLLTYTSQRYVGDERWKHVLYLTFFLTGARLGEVLGLEWNRIHFDKDRISITQFWCAIEKKIIFTTKGKKDLIIPLNSQLKKELGAIKNSSKGTFIFSDKGDRPIDPANFRNRNWFKDLEAAGIRRIRIHDLRHTYASLFMMNDGNLYDLKAVLNHSSVKTTEKYAHLSNHHLDGVKDIIKPNIGFAADVISMGDGKSKESSRPIHARETVLSESVI